MTTLLVPDKTMEQDVLVQLAADILRSCSSIYQTRQAAGITPPTLQPGSTTAFWSDSSAEINTARTTTLGQLSRLTAFFKALTIFSRTSSPPTGTTVRFTQFYNPKHSKSCLLLEAVPPFPPFQPNLRFQKINSFECCSYSAARTWYVSRKTRFSPSLRCRSC